MSNFREKALEISAKYEFSSPDMVISATNEDIDVAHPLASCKNHLDEDFMAWLKDGLHLDSSIVPL